RDSGAAEPRRAETRKGVMHRASVTCSARGGALAVALSLHRDPDCRFRGGTSRRPPRDTAAPRLLVRRPAATVRSSWPRAARGNEPPAGARARSPRESSPPPAPALHAALQTAQPSADAATSRTRAPRAV